MAEQLDTTLRTAMAQALCDALANGSLRLFAGSLPASCAAADPATLLATGTLPATAATASNGVATRAGTWAFTGGAGAVPPANATVYRLYRSAGSGGGCMAQGSVTIAGGIAAACTLTAGNTTITAPANSIPNGTQVTGAGIQADTQVVSGGGTTSIVLSRPPLVSGAGVSLTFAGDLTLDNPSIANTQGGAVTTWTRTMPGA